MRKLRKLVVAGTAVAAVLVTAGPASADAPPPLTTSDGGGSLLFTRPVPGLDVLKACDLKKDGFGVRAYASYFGVVTRQGQTAPKQGPVVPKLVRDVDGANGNCVTLPIASKPGPVTLVVCLQDHNGRGTVGPYLSRTDLFCRSASVGG